MNDDPFFDDLMRVAEMLIERGYVRRFFYRGDTNGVIKFEFTEKGLNLRKQLRELFDVPKINLESLTASQIADSVMVILMAEPIVAASGGLLDLVAEDKSDDRAQVILKEWHDEIKTMAHRLISKGWLNCFFWEYDSDANPVRFIPDFTKLGITNLCAIYKTWKKSGLESLADMELQTIPFIGELGQPMTDEDLGVLSIVAGVCSKNYGNTDF